MHFVIINGPNLNLLGKREPDIYGDRSFEDYLEELSSEFNDHLLSYFQSNHEGDIIDKIQEAGFSCDGIVLNPAAYTHTSIAIADAVKAVPAPVIEVHISNILERETFRRQSFLRKNCLTSFMGQGLEGYRLAILHLLNYADQ